MDTERNTRFIVATLENTGIELLVYLNEFFAKWIQRVPALAACVSLNDEGEVFTNQQVHIHDSDTSEHLWFDGPLADFKIYVESSRRGPVYRLEYRSSRSRETFKSPPEVAQKMARLAFGNANHAMKESDKDVFKK